MRTLVLLVLMSAIANSAEICRIELKDIGFFGGQDIVLRRTGEVLTRKVTRQPPGKHAPSEIDIRFKLDENKRKDFISDVGSVIKYKEKKRDGIPDEMHTTILIYYDDGSMSIRSKWATDKDEIFDHCYNALLDLLKVNGVVEYSGDERYWVEF